MLGSRHTSATPDGVGSFPNGFFASSSLHNALGSLQYGGADFSALDRNVVSPPMRPPSSTTTDGHLFGPSPGSSGAAVPPRMEVDPTIPGDRTQPGTPLPDAPPMYAASATGTHTLPPQAPFLRITRTSPRRGSRPAEPPLPETPQDSTSSEEEVTPPGIDKSKSDYLFDLYRHDVVVKFIRKPIKKGGKMRRWDLISVAFKIAEICDTLVWESKDGQPVTKGIPHTNNDGTQSFIPLTHAELSKWILKSPGWVKEAQRAAINLRDPNVLSQNKDYADMMNRFNAGAQPVGNDNKMSGIHPMAYLPGSADV